MEQIKLQKKDNLKRLKAVERCLERDGSMLDAELEYRIPVGNMDNLTEVARDEVPWNPHRQTEDSVVSQVISEDITDEIATDAGDRDAADINEISAFEMVKTYFETVGLYTDFHTVYEEARLLTDYYEKQTAEEFIQKRTEQIIETMGLLGINAREDSRVSGECVS